MVKGFTYPVMGQEESELKISILILLRYMLSIIFYLR